MHEVQVKYDFTDKPIILQSVRRIVIRFRMNSIFYFDGKKCNPVSFSKSVSIIPIFPLVPYITYSYICNRRMNKFFKFFLAEVRRECACMSSYLALQIPHQKVISFEITFQPERVVHTPVNRNLLFTKIC